MSIHGDDKESQRCVSDVSHIYSLYLTAQGPASASASPYAREKTPPKAEWELYTSLTFKMYIFKSITIGTPHKSRHLQQFNQKACLETSEI